MYPLYLLLAVGSQNRKDIVLTSQRDLLPTAPVPESHHRDKGDVKLFQDLFHLLPPRGVDREEHHVFSVEGVGRGFMEGTVSKILISKPDPEQLSQNGMGIAKKKTHVVGSQHGVAIGS